MTFPVYAASGWRTVIQRSEWNGDHLAGITIAHVPIYNDDPWAVPAFTVTTTIPGQQASERDVLLYALEMWFPEDSGTGRGLSDAATKVRFAARTRDRWEAVRTCVRGEFQIVVDGRQRTFAALSTLAGIWVGSCHHHELLLTVAGHDGSAPSLELEAIADLRAHLLGPKPSERSAA